MKRNGLLALFLLAVSAALFPPQAENLLSLKIGTTWPQALLNTGIPSGDAELQYGIIVDRKIAFGVAGDFLWNTRSKDVPGYFYGKMACPQRR